MKKLTDNKERPDKIEVLIPKPTKGLKVPGRKKGKVTPRQTFRCDEVLWKRFQKVCRSKESKSASEVLRRFIRNYVG